MEFHLPQFEEKYQCTGDQKDSPKGGEAGFLQMLVHSIIIITIITTIITNNNTSNNQKVSYDLTCP